MDVSALKANLAAVMPLLQLNRDAAYTEWMDGSLARGAYEHVQSRFDTAHAVMNKENVDAISAFKACSMLTIDIRSAVADVNTESARQSQDAWINCYREAGFTEAHTIFGTPVLPANFIFEEVRNA
jgi:hypothetical protein